MFFFFYFNEFAPKLFDHLGIKYKKSRKDLKDSNYDYLVIDKYGHKIMVEIKNYNDFIDVPDSIVLDSIKKLKKYRMKSTTGNLSEYSMLIVFNKVADEVMKTAEKENIILIDISNILFLIKDSEKITAELKSVLTYSTVDIVEKDIDLYNYFNLRNFVESNFYSKSFKEDDLIDKIVNLPRGNSTSREFEKIGEDIIKYIFEDYLYGWISQPDAANGMYRFDLIAKIKKQSGFWGMLYNFFKSRYVIFEFKNYEKEITQAQVYTTEKYLYNKALRNIAFIITREGLNDNASRACAGSLREQGKLILVLNESDLIELLKLKKDRDNRNACTEYLEAKFDHFLMDLDK